MFELHHTIYEPVTIMFELYHLKHEPITIMFELTPWMEKLNNLKIE